MRHVERFSLIVAFLVGMMVVAAPAMAQATRTWVSGVGDDANPCSRTAPCKTFAGAISKTMAGGEINVLDPGGFGAVTITKSISIIARGELAGILVSGTNGVIIAAGVSDTVVLDGLEFEGLGTGLSGVRALTAGRVIVRNCTIADFGTAGIEVAPTAAMHVLVDQTQILGSPTGILVTAPTSDTTVTVHRSSLVGNATAGIKADGADAKTYVSDSLITGSTTAFVVANHGHNTSLGNNTVVDNGSVGTITGRAALR